MALVNMAVEIDDEMLPLIEALNKLGLRTVSCCSGHPEDEDSDGYAYVSVLMENINSVKMFENEGRMELVIDWKRKLEGE